MALSCTFGLAACLAFNGVDIPYDAAIKISDTCDLLPQLQENSFDGPTGYGIVAGETIESLGVKLEWARPGALRKAHWIQTCAAFDAAFNNRQAWSHLEKVPNP